MSETAGQDDVGGVAQIGDDDGFPCLKPHRQRPLKRLKHRPHHSRWIVAVYHDESFELAAAELNEVGQMVYSQISGQKPYADFWRTVEALKLSRGTWWIVAWRTRYAIEKAGMLTALDSGAIGVPKTRSAKVRSGTAGRTTLSGVVVEMDLVCGRNKVKLIDYKQLGIKHEQFGLEVKSLTLEDSRRALESYLRLCDTIKVSASRTTAAQTGYATFKSWHMPAVLCVNLDDDARELERLCYFNGRTEAFRLGDIPGKTFSLDVKSCYACISQREKLPCFQLAYYPKGVPIGIVDPNGENQWIASVVLRVDTADYPLRWGGIPVYPTGTYHTSIAWPELRHALIAGRVDKITRAARYSSSIVFSRYAEWFFKWRQRLKNGSLSPMLPTLKAMFNASLGFTARGNYDWQEWVVAKPRRWWIGLARSPECPTSCVQARVMDGIPEYLSTAGEPYEAMPFLHATITSYARVKLLGLMDVAGRRNVLYVDTDGLLVTQEGEERLRAMAGVCGDEPGQLVERFEPGKCRIGGQKNYRIGRHYICAGGINTRRSLMTEQEVLTTDTGRVDTRGIVSPFEFSCEDTGDGEARYTNKLA